MPVLTVPKNLRHKLGDDESDELVLLLNESNNELKTDIIELVEERFAAKLTQAISGLRAEFKEDNASLRSELKQDMANLRAELKQDMTNLRAELKQDMANLRAELKEDNANLRAELITRFDTRLSETKITLIKWMVGLMLAFSTLNITVLSIIMSLLK